MRVLVWEQRVDWTFVAALDGPPVKFTEDVRSAVAEHMDRYGWVPPGWGVRGAAADGFEITTSSRWPTKRPQPASSISAAEPVGSRWASVRTIADVHRALVPGRHLVFDTRDPDARKWERWSTYRRRSVTLPDGRVVQEWTEVTAVEHDTVSFAIHYRFPDHAELVSRATLRFRSADELRESLRAAKFTVEQIYGGWNREPIGQGDGEFVVIARADPRKDSRR